MGDALQTESLETRLWKNTVLMAVPAFLFYAVYVTILDSGFHLTSFAKVIAGVSNLFLGISLSLSSFGYYFNFLDSKVVYRKYFGLVGYFAALFYCVLLAIVRPERYFFGFFENFFTSDILLGLLSMVIFTGMALISNNKAMLWIGPQRWRKYLRFGFLAYFLLVVRAYLNNENPIGSEPIPEMWGLYLTNPEGLPPARLLFSVIAMAVIFFRLSLEVDKWRKKRYEAAGAQSSPSAPLP